MFQIKHPMEKASKIPSAFFNEGKDSETDPRIAPSISMLCSPVDTLSSPISVTNVSAHFACRMASFGPYLFTQ